MSKLEIKNLDFSYKANNKTNEILKNINIQFEVGKVYAIVGESGSGKTTTLSLLGALDIPDSGSIMYDDKDIKKIGYTNYRKNNISLVFQNYNLIKYMNAIENVIVAIDIKNSRNLSAKEKLNYAVETLKSLGISEDNMKRPILELSGGQQQRVAIARALVKDTDVILADEPTGNLDEETTNEILEILINLAHKNNKCIIIVTHSANVSKNADVVVKVAKKTLTVINND